MLRLNAGWSAEKLSQEYALGGAGSLTRTTIAKIEKDKRLIRGGEAEGVARLFGLTSTDLLGQSGPHVLLSYAEQDIETGQQVSAWLSERGFHVLAGGSPRVADPQRDSGRDGAIDTADAFVVLFSASFLSSGRRREDLGLALRREQNLHPGGPVGGYVKVLRLPGAPELGDTELAAYPSVDLDTASDRSTELTLSKLGASILTGSAASADEPSPSADAQEGAAVLDRSDEVERVLNALNSPAAADFWLVIGPPGFGKSWFLGQLEAKAADAGPGGWITRKVDLRSWPSGSGFEHDAMQVVREIFRPELPQSAAGPDAELRDVAKSIIRAGQSRLYLLDSAELMSADAVGDLRGHLGEVYGRIHRASNAGARLAFVAASRRDDGWGGVIPYPRISFQSIGGFGTGAVQAALEKLARDTKVVRSPAELRRDAEHVRRATEGVPELIEESLRWIQAEEWLDIDRLIGPQIVATFIRDRLLAQDSILPRDDDMPGDPACRMNVMLALLHALVPYRFITMSHVRQHINDLALGEVLKDQGWDPDNLWEAIGHMALLLRPLDEPWHEIYPAVRRMLERYFYTDEERADAHGKARDFSKCWASQLTGKDRVIGMIETIWHETIRLAGNETTMKQELPGLARGLSRDLSSAAYSTTELRGYAIRRIEGDDELQHELAKVDRLFGALVSAIRDPAVRED